MKKISILMLALVLLSACGSSKSKDDEKGNSCTYDSGDSKIVEKVTYTTSEKEKIETITYVKTAPIPKESFDEQSTEELQELFEKQYIVEARDQSGMDISVKVDGKKHELSVKIEIDAKKVKPYEMSALGMDNYKTVKELRDSLVSNKDFKCDIDKKK